MAGAHTRTQCCIDYFGVLFSRYESNCSKYSENIVLFIARGTIISQKGVWLLAHCFCWVVRTFVENARYCRHSNYALVKK